MKIPTKEVTIKTVMALKTMVQESIGQGDTVLDFSTVKSVDSAALVLILEAKRLLKIRNKKLELLGVQPELQSLVSLYGLEELFTPLFSSNSTL